MSEIVRLYHASEEIFRREWGRPDNGLRNIFCEGERVFTHYKNSDIIKVYNCFFLSDEINRFY